MTNKLREDIEGTRARIATLRSQLSEEEDRLAQLRGVEQAQLDDRVAAYERMTAEEQIRLREESPSTFAQVMEAKRQAGMKRLYAQQGAQ